MNRRGLAWKLYALGVVQLALVAAAALFVVIREAPPPLPHNRGRQVELAASRLKALLQNPADLTTELNELRTHGLEGSIYDEAGTVLATNVTPPLPRPHVDRSLSERHFAPPPWSGPPDEGLDPARARHFFPDPPPETPPPPPMNEQLYPIPPPGDPPDRLWMVVLAAEGVTSRPVFVARFVPPPRDLRGLVFTLGLGLLLVGVGSVLTARWIVRPLEQLSRAARALGEGDLRARTGLTRKDEVGDVSRTFDEMAARVERLVRAEKELLANVSHELRTPLARIRVALDLAEEGDAEAARAALSEISVDLAELESLLNDVFTAARIETENNKVSPTTLALHLEDVQPSTIVDRALERFRSHHPDRRVDVAVEESLPLVRVDAVLVRRVIDNLLENAHKYSPDAAKPIDLRATGNGDKVDFEVRDWGIGIAPEDLPNVFVPFFRGERSRSRGSGGVGLGLTLAKRIVEAHGGTIDVTSAHGAGTTARVELPLARP